MPLRIAIVVIVLACLAPAAAAPNEPLAETEPLFEQDPRNSRLFEPLYRQALAKRREGLGSDHPKVADSLLALAGVLESRQDYQQAEPLLREALAIRKKSFDAADDSVQESLVRLADLLVASGDTREAVTLYERAIKTHGEAATPVVATLLKKLASALEAQSDLAAAELHYRRALAIRRRALPPDDPNRAASAHDLGFLLESRGKPDESEKLYREALGRIREILWVRPP